MNKDLMDLIKEKKGFIKKNKDNKNQNVRAEVTMTRQLIFVLKKHKGICPTCGVNPICPGFARNALTPTCSKCEEIRRYENNGKDRKPYQQVLIEAVNTKPMALAT